MGKSITIEQSHNAISILANNVVWDELDSATLQRVINDPREAGRNFTTFLKNGGRVIIGEPKIIQVDRSTPFNLEKFLAGWSIWKGPEDGDGLSGDEEQDGHSLSLTEIDLTKVRLDHFLKNGESSIKGEERLQRLKAGGYPRLDAKVFLTLWENQHLIPERWKEKTNGNTTYIFFDGTILRSPDGSRVALCLYWDDGEWHLHVRWLSGGWGRGRPSAVLVK